MHSYNKQHDNHIMTKIGQLALKFLADTRMRTYMMHRASSCS